MIECRDEQRDVIWVDKENGIAKCHGDARCVTIFVKDSDDSTKITAIEICASSIKKLYQGITEIEKQTSEESID
ncbi:MAG TPA: hypothetical protein VI911_00185 [Patescibacteria group bacterium]|nr:hypothetical protein [Patescibacteria group bacterium]